MVCFEYSVIIHGYILFRFTEYSKNNTIYAKAEEPVIPIGTQNTTQAFSLRNGSTVTLDR